ncbi:3-methyl-2-oxobutanoate hydroxymethyltransferase [Halobacteriovorax sp. GB3]|uniref:3-methyl-2-oxobutanoate hydroxymethyltransferase n=1 Tax=Halobacteriovorax sp. GB3 TaxID=2719615 RepID=UPI00235EE0CB|nr:3-methyl-2-oxobutanoate hydroxymethyltransferase [Halobacteriovorax sp. GB3]MDD0854073.1 3-methyl-2-oxobutanoate hydroxymethyltransferase [Halobacteriovorax sp. GB3]
MTTKKQSALNTLKIRKNKIKKGATPLQMLTCYDYQTARMLNETDVDLLLVGDSVGNVVLGYETTVQVTIDEMKIFSAAVKRGAPNKFIVADLPFGTYATVDDGIKNAIELFQYSKAEAIKLEGAYPHHLELIQRLTQTGIPVMGHLGLTPQSVYELGGYYMHGKTDKSAKKLVQEAIALQEAGCFSIVLECVSSDLATKITEMLDIPTIGIGAGELTDGQVLVINDLLHLGPERPPKFCQPVANLFELKKSLIQDYLKSRIAPFIEEQPPLPLQ